MKIKRYSIELTPDNMLDVVLIWERPGILQKFALNYRTYLRKKWYEVYRVDNYHGFLHEQKFWRDSQPIPILHKEGWPIPLVFNEYRDEIIEKFEKYREYFERSLLQNE